MFIATFQESVYLHIFFRTSVELRQARVDNIIFSSYIMQPLIKALAIFWILNIRKLASSFEYK